MATIRNLKVAVSAQTSKFNAGMKRAGKSLRGFRKQAMGLKRIMLGLGLAFGAIGAVRVFNRMRQDLDTIGKLSDRLKITTTGLLALRHAARITGLEGDALNKGMEVFARRLGEVKLGTGEGKRALEELGLAADDLVSLNLEDAFAAVADKMKDLGTQAEKAAVANLLFGRAGVRLINMLDLGSEGLRQFRDDMELLGGNFNRKQIKQVEDMNDAFARLGFAAESTGRRMTVTLAPALKRASDSITRFLIDNRDKIDAFFRSTFMSVKRAIGAFAALGQALFPAADVALRALGIRLGFVTGKLGVLAVATGLWLQSMAALTKLGGKAFAGLFKEFGAEVTPERLDDFIRIAEKIEKFGASAVKGAKDILDVSIGAGDVMDKMAELQNKLKGIGFGKGGAAPFGGALLGDTPAEFTKAMRFGERAHNQFKTSISGAVAAGFLGADIQPFLEQFKQAFVQTIAEALVESVVGDFAKESFTSLFRAIGGSFSEQGATT